MLTLGDMCAEPDFSLRIVDGSPPAADRVVDAVRVLPGTSWERDPLADVGDELVVIRPFADGLADRQSGNGKSKAREAAERLLRELARQRAAALVVAVDRHGAAAVPAAIRVSAARLSLPLLTTTKSLQQWSELAPRVREYRRRHAEWQAEQLAALLNRLPDRLDDADAAVMQRVADWLAAALEGEVLVSDPQRGVLAASPATAPGTFAPLLVGRSVEPPGAVTPNTRFVPLAGAGSGAVLAVTASRPFDDAGTDLTRHAAKVLGLIDQAGRRHHQVADSERQLRLSAFQLLMIGEEAAAQRVMAPLAPGLLDMESLRVYVIDCADEDREITARLAERAVADHALMVRCPAFNHLIILDPARDGAPGNTYDPSGLPLTSPSETAEELRRIVTSLSSHRMGGSRVCQLGEVADAYEEARNALAQASRLPDRVALGEDRMHLVDVLPPKTARRWAGTLLHPLLTLPMSRRDQLLRTLDLGLEVRHKAAGRLLGVHRNTVTHRMNTCFDLLGLDRDRVLNQIAVSTALKIVMAHGHDDLSADPEADFAAMVSVPEVRAWAESFLRPLKDDPRDLPRTLRAWLENDTHVESTATALGISPVTVRAHLRTAAPLIQRELTLDLDGDTLPDDDDHVLSGVRPLAFALHATTGRPLLPSRPVHG
ncbi:helix-turn-helix domain-containing protein [Streptomyces sp. NBC_00286]|uniref:helix-turn-helix domain-containing protein n=1 Tax=Streptomyces sp. NBC_00286 TaxID=2975701 RepID=UPI002E29A083|nr:helix-turn-helix domain-containing protein [Streptomyces sp. NBC_00286]